MKVIVSGGGTAGHINPAVAIAKYIQSKNEDAEILYIGTEYGMEKRLVPKEGFNIKYIDVRGFQRKLSLKNIGVALKAYRAIGASKAIIKEFGPDIVIGTGGYVCGPVLKAASQMGIPTIVHEQNVFPGMTVKMLAQKVDTIVTSFDTTQNYLKTKKKIVLTGNPVRPDLLDTPHFVARLKLQVDDRPLILMMGGSLGSKTMNDAVVEIVKKFDTSGYNLLVSTGERNYQTVKDQLKGVVVPKNIKIEPYIYNTNIAFSAADLIVCRTGAITISELGAAGKAAILVPSPNVAHNHQEYNARYLAEKGAAVMIKDDELTGEALHNTIMELIGNRERIREMEKNAKLTGITNASEKIYGCVLELLGKKADGIKIKDIEMPQNEALAQQEAAKTPDGGEQNTNDTAKE